MVIKKRYDKHVTSDKTLQRAFSSSNASKYQTVGKFFSVPAKIAPDPVKATANSIEPTDQDKQNDLDLFDKLVSQAVANQDLANSQQTPNQQVPSRAKEVLSAQAQEVVDQVETPVQAEVAENQEDNSSVEAASSPEVAELSKELQEVSKETKEQREQAMIKEKQQQISDLAANATAPVAVSDKPVVVLPITAKSKEEAKFKSTKYSVKWLLEWCKKIAKIFSGAVVYKEEVEDV